MKSSDLMLIQRVIREMQIRNYSERSIQCYTSILSKIVNHFDIPLTSLAVARSKIICTSALWLTKSLPPR